MWKIFLNDYVGLALFAFILAFLLILLALKLFPRLGLMDRPHRYGLDRKPIPYYGGLSIFLAFIVSLLVFVPLSKTVIGLVIAGTLIVLIGFVDDYFGLKPIVRLIWQFLAGLILVLSGVYIFSINLPFFGDLDLNRVIFYGIPLLSALFTIVWLMTIINAMNFVDGVSGLNSGVTFIAGMTLFLLSIHPGIHENPSSQASVATISLIIAMIALAFFLFDFPKPQILMGDSGSTFFGFMIASLAIFSGGKVATAFLVLGIVLLDMVWVILRRILSGQKFWQGDRGHLHHRLLDLGLSERKAVLIYLALTAVFGMGSVIFVNSNQKFFILIGLILLMLVLAASLILLPKKNPRGKLGNKPH